MYCNIVTNYKQLLSLLAYVDFIETSSVAMWLQSPTTKPVSVLHNIIRKACIFLYVLSQFISQNSLNTAILCYYGKLMHYFQFYYIAQRNRNRRSGLKSKRTCLCEIKQTIVIYINVIYINRNMSIDQVLSLFRMKVFIFIITVHIIVKIFENI